jgi:Ca2+-binding RTX toxin-like protein
LSVAATATTAAYTLTQDSSVLSGISTLEVRGVAKAEAVTSATSATDTLYGGVSFTNAAGTETLDIASGAFNVSGAVENTATTTSQEVVSVLNATVSASLKTNTTADAITVNLGSSSGSTLGIESNTATLTNSTEVGSVVSVNSVITLSLDDYETVTLNARAGSSTLDTLTSTGLKTLNITGNKDLTISAATAANVTSIDASKFTGNLSLTSSTSTKAQTIVAGSGNDTIVADTSSRNDSIDGGAGNDTIGISNSTAGGTGTGNDTMLGGEGNDTIYSGAGNDVIDGGANDDSIVGAVGNDSLSGAAGNDTFKMAYDATATSVATSLAFNSNDTVDGGDGTDSIQLTGTATTALAIDLSGSTLTNFTNVKNIERIQYNIANTATTGTNSLSVGDVLIGSFNNGLTVTVGTSAATNAVGLSVDASAVLNTASTVTYTGATAVATSMTLGNGIDKYTGGTADDSAYVSNVLFLQATDTLTGGVGSDTLSFRTNGTLTLTADKFAGVTSFETFTVANTSTYNAASKITLSDAVVVANAATATNSFTVSRTSSETGTLTVDGSTITGTNLVLTGASGADTLTGGAFNDTITGGSGADSMTGGAGNDMFTYTAAGQASGDVIVGGDNTDTVHFNLATATSDTTVDMTYASWSGIEVLRLDRGASTGKTIATFTTTQLSGSTYSVAAVAGTGTGVAQITATGGSTSSTLNFSGLTPANTSSDGATELVFSYSSTATTGQYITGSGLSDAIAGGAGADTIYGGDGSDTITDSALTDIYYLTDSSTATSITDTVVAIADTGTNIALAATAVIDSTTSVVTDGSANINFLTTAAAIVYGAGAGDSVTSALSLLTNGTAKSSSAIVTADKVNTVRGSFDQSTGTFTYSATGTDTLVAYDSNGIISTAAYDAIVLVGVSTVTLGASTAAMSVTFAS